MFNAEIPIKPELIAIFAALVLAFLITFRYISKNYQKTVLLRKKVLKL